jgi:hypothetical protein
LGVDRPWYLGVESGYSDMTLHYHSKFRVGLDFYEYDFSSRTSVFSGLRIHPNFSLEVALSRYNDTIYSFINAQKVVADGRLSEDVILVKFDAYNDHVLSYLISFRDKYKALSISVGIGIAHWENVSRIRTTPINSNRFESSHEINTHHEGLLNTFTALYPLMRKIDIRYSYRNVETKLTGSKWYVESHSLGLVMNW